MTFPRVLGVFFPATVLLFGGAPLGAAELLRVLDSQVVNLGPRSITYNRVVTPELKPAPAPTPVAEVIPTGTELEEMPPWNAKRDAFAFLSCTIYDGQFTVVEWQEDGQWVRFLSTVNFHYLRPLSDFETAGSYYSFFMMPGDCRREEFEEWGRFLAGSSFGSRPPPWPFALLRRQEQTGESAWQLLSAEPVSGEVLRTIEDLHRYFDAHREQLIRGHEENEAARLAQEKWLKENPPVPKDTVVEFFPIRSSQAPDRLGRNPFNPQMPR